MHDISNMGMALIGMSGIATYVYSVKGDYVIGNHITSTQAESALATAVCMYKNYGHGTCMVCPVYIVSVDYVTTIYIGWVG